MPIFQEFLLIGSSMEDEPMQILDYYSPNNTETPDYLRNVNIMCLIETSNNSEDINARNYLHQFILTDQVGCRRYCTSLIIYEQQESNQYFSKYAYIIVSQESNLISQKIFMTAIYNGIFDRFTRYRDRGWNLCNIKLKNQQLFEFYLSLGLTTLKGIYYLPKQSIHKNRQEIANDIMIYNPSYRNNIFNNKEVCFKMLFSKLSIQSIIKIIQCIILEKQIILFTAQVWDLANITEALLQFIYPLQWRCIYIPYLPAQLIDTLHASVPYIIGININQKERVLTTIDCLDKVLVDLDKDRVIGCNLLTQQFPETTINQLYSECSKLNQQFLYDDVQLRSLQCSFFKFIIQLINNILPYFRYINNEYSNIEDIFNKEQYIQLHSFNDQEFYKEFVNKTMMFPRLIEECYKILYLTEILNGFYSSSELSIYIDILKSVQTTQYFQINHSKAILSKLNRLIQIENQEIEPEQSAHSLFAKYILKIQIKEFGDRQFPIIKINHNLIQKFENSISIMNKINIPTSTKSNLKNEINEENKEQIFFSFFPVMKINNSEQKTTESESTVIIKYPKNPKKVNKISKEYKYPKQKFQSTLRTPIKDYYSDIASIKADSKQQQQQQQYQQQQLQQYSNRSTKRIFNLNQSGYQSMYKTKTYASLRQSKY